MIFFYFFFLSNLFLYIKPTLCSDFDTFCSNLEPLIDLEEDIECGTFFSRTKTPPLEDRSISEYLPLGDFSYFDWKSLESLSSTKDNSINYLQKEDNGAKKRKLTTMQRDEEMLYSLSSMEQDSSCSPLKTSPSSKRFSDQRVIIRISSLTPVPETYTYTHFVCVSLNTKQCYPINHLHFLERNVYNNEDDLISNHTVFSYIPNFHYLFVWLSFVDGKLIISAPLYVYNFYTSDVDENIIFRSRILLKTELYIEVQINADMANDILPLTVHPSISNSKRFFLYLFDSELLYQGIILNSTNYSKALIDLREKTTLQNIIVISTTADFVYQLQSYCIVDSFFALNGKPIVDMNFTMFTRIMKNSSAKSPTIPKEKKHF